MSGTLERFSLGPELHTDAGRLQFPIILDEWDAYSVAYAIPPGTAATLEVPDTDLNVTISGGVIPGESAVVLYGSVPGWWRNWSVRRYSPMCFARRQSAYRAIAAATRTATVAFGVTAFSLRTLSSSGSGPWRFLADKGQ